MFCYTSAVLIQWQIKGRSHLGLWTLGFQECHHCKFGVAQIRLAKYIYLTLWETSTGTDSTWCTGSPENYNGASVYTVTGAKAEVTGDTVTCSIQSVVLESPA